MECMFWSCKPLIRVSSEVRCEAVELKLSRFSLLFVCVYVQVFNQSCQVVQDYQEPLSQLTPQEE